VIPGWKLVTKREPCQCCAKPDWCLIKDDGTEALCQRVESDKRWGDAGWLHKLTDPIPVYRAPKPKRKPEPPPDFGKLAWRCMDTLPDQDDLARQLGVSEESLGRLIYGYSKRHMCWTFPMRLPNGAICGILRRFRDGTKRTWKGSRNGLFVPTNLHAGLPLWICEGPTDTAAMLTVGLEAIGRMGNTGGKAMLIEYVTRWKCRDIIIMADRDRAGSDAERLTLHGAESLAGELTGKHVRIVRPPGKKDARQCVQSGWTREVFEAIAK